MVIDRGMSRSNTHCRGTVGLMSITFQGVSNNDRPAASAVSTVCSVNSGAGYGVEEGIRHGEYGRIREQEAMESRLAYLVANE